MFESNPYDSGGDQQSKYWSLPRSLRFWVPAAVCVIALLAIPVAYMAGVVLTIEEMYSSSASRQKDRIEAFLSQHPSKYQRLTVERASDGWAYVIGHVASAEDLTNLRDKLKEMFGDKLSEDMTRTVRVD